MEKKHYTIGEIGRISGVSPKTIRFYDEKGLLKPVGYSESGYRYYDASSFVTLQRILLLRYLGMSLEQIKETICNSSLSLEESLQEQKKLLNEKKRHLDRVIDAVDKVQNADAGQIWENLVEAIRILEVSDMVIKQYRSDENLNRRINLHNYSTGKMPWADWVLENLEISEGMEILCLGCGNASNLAAMAEKLPENLTFLLTDYSEGMLEKAKEGLAAKKTVLEEKNIRIEYRVADANCLSLLGSYDRITANHMLYHVEKRQDLFRKVRQLLKSGGMFCATTVGDSHMKELHELVERFDSRIEMPFQNITGSFRLENGREQLAKVFSEIECVICDSDLLVDTAEPVYEYVYSYPGNAGELIKNRKEEFLGKLNEIIEREGAFYIHKSTGMFKCRA
ncbi:MAG: MerR family transcriptional regulator [Lachnospiraceae bacterium]|nr:MerR family transcriptional regulator [Lachnospiraceae bacterium]